LGDGRGEVLEGVGIGAGRGPRGGPSRDDGLRPRCGGAGHGLQATIAEPVIITSDAEGRILSGGTGARQQQIAEVSEKGIEDYLSTH
jgi:hypothetical protein